MKYIETITAKSFSLYGKVLEFSSDLQDINFEIVISEEQSPWRLAMFRVLNKQCDQLECHPTSLESFEPVSGTGILLVAAPESPHDYHAFLLDKPVCLYKKVWHSMLTLSDESIVKITENIEVSTEFFKLPKVVYVEICDEENIK